MPTPRKYENAAARHAAYRKRQAEARRQEQQRKGLPTLPAIPTMPGTARWDKMLAEVTEVIRTVIGEREDYHEDRSESWQESDKGEAFVETTDALKEVEDLLDALA